MAKLSERIRAGAIEAIKSLLESAVTFDEPGDAFAQIANTIRGATQAIAECSDYWDREDVPE